MGMRGDVKDGLADDWVEESIGDGDFGMLVGPMTLLERRRNGGDDGPGRETGGSTTGDVDSGPNGSGGGLDGCGDGVGRRPVVGSSVGVGPGLEERPEGSSLAAATTVRGEAKFGPGRTLALVARVWIHLEGDGGSRRK